MDLDVHLLILKFLESGPFKEEARSIGNQLERQLPSRLDFLGNKHEQTLQEYMRKFPNIRSDSLPNMLMRLIELINEKIPPSVQCESPQSLLYDGHQSLLRNEKMLSNQYRNKCIQALHTGKYFSRKNVVTNLAYSLRARAHMGYMPLGRLLPAEFHQRPRKYRSILGHLSPVYCVTFDQTGKFIFTGADDNLIKIWSALDGRLLATLRGHSGEITDLSVNYENTLLASGSVDKFVRIWDLQTTAMLACLNAHNAMISSVKFSPYNKYDNDNRFLISTSNDGYVCFWKYNTKTKEFGKPCKRNERIKPSGQMSCSSFTSGGTFLAIGSTDNYVKIFGFFNSLWPWYSIDVELHSNQVDNLQFSHQGLRLVSGSKDGTAIIWTFECQEWRTIRLNMRDTLPHGQEEQDISDDKMAVTMVAWSLDDKYVVTSVGNSKIKVWNSTTGMLVHEFLGHTQVIYCIENHPKDPRIILTGGHDGQIFLWDLEKGKCIKSFANLIEGQWAAALLDVKFSPDGLMFAATDNCGNLSLFGYGEADNYQAVPDQIFFQTDYRPLIRDVNNFALDEQTHQAPHLMAPALLVDVDGNPHPAQYQLLVPEPNRPANTRQNVIPPLRESELERRQAELANIMDCEEETFVEQNKKPKLPPIIQQNVNNEQRRDRERQLRITASSSHQRQSNSRYNSSGPQYARRTPTTSNNNLYSQRTRAQGRASASASVAGDAHSSNNNPEGVSFGLRLRNTARRSNPQRFNIDQQQPSVSDNEMDWNDPTDESSDSDYTQPIRRPQHRNRRKQRRSVSRSSSSRGGGPRKKRRAARRANLRLAECLNDNNEDQQDLQPQNDRRNDSRVSNENNVENNELLPRARTRRPPRQLQEYVIDDEDYEEDEEEDDEEEENDTELETEETVDDESTETESQTSDDDATEEEINEDDGESTEIDESISMPVDVNRKRSRSSSSRRHNSNSGRNNTSRRSTDSHELRPRSKRKKTRYCSGCSSGYCGSRHR